MQKCKISSIYRIFYLLSAQNLLVLNGKKSNKQLLFYQLILIRIYLPFKNFDLYQKAADFDNSNILTNQSFV